MKRILSVAAVLAAAVPLGLWKSTPAGAEGSGERWRSRATMRGRPPPAQRPPSPETSASSRCSIQTNAALSAPPRFRSHRVRGPHGTPIRPSDAYRYLRFRMGAGMGGHGRHCRRRCHLVRARREHLHRGTADTAMTHIAIQGFVDGRPVDSMEHVTEHEYCQ